MRRSLDRMILTIRSLQPPLLPPLSLHLLAVAPPPLLVPLLLEQHLVLVLVLVLYSRTFWPFGRIHMHIDMCVTTNMCIDICIGMCNRHVYRHAAKAY